MLAVSTSFLFLSETRVLEAQWINLVGLAGKGSVQALVQPESGIVQICFDYLELRGLFGPDRAVEQAIYLDMALCCPAGRTSKITRYLYGAVPRRYGFTMKPVPPVRRKVDDLSRRLSLMVCVSILMAYPPLTYSGRISEI